MSETMIKKQLEGSEIQTGACHYCGQIYQFETDGMATEEQLDAWAVEKCDCHGARIEQKRVNRAAEAKDNIRELAGENQEEAVDLICQGIDHLLIGKIATVAVTTRGGYKLSATINAKGNLKTEITKTVKKSKEA